MSMFQTPNSNPHHSTRMAKRTALEFYRRKQTIDSLATERPQSLKSVYDIISHSVERLEQKVDMLMTSYYGNDETLEKQLKKWLPLISFLLGQGRSSELVCKDQLEEFYIKHESLLDRSPFEEETLTSVNDVINHILTSVNEGFHPITSSVEELIGFMGKYLKSFSYKEGDKYLETCTNYEKQICDLERAVFLNIQNIYLMTKKFTEECLTMDHFDYVSKDRAAKYGCVIAPVVLVFPAACDCIRNAFSGIRRWLEADANYVDYLQYDLRELEQNRDICARELKELQLNVSSQEHKFKFLTKDIEQLEIELDRLKSKETTINKDERVLSLRQKSMNVDLEVKLYRLTELKHVTPREVGPRQYKEQLERLNTEITLLKDQRPRLDRSLTDIQTKKSWIADRRLDKQAKEKSLEVVRASRRKIKKQCRLCEVELLRLNNCIQQIKNVVARKTSEEILRKIFHNLSLASTPSHTPRKRIDKTDRVLNAVANYVGNDWIKLYWQLPFYPLRGEETKRQDIEDISRNHVRHNMEDLARESLKKWRRLHTRVTISALHEALLGIKRKDIVDRLEKDFKVQPQCSVNPKLYRTVHFPQIPVVDCMLF